VLASAAHDARAPALATMIDPRLQQLREAATAMGAGRFDVDVPVVPEDEVGQLGRALSDLGHTLERQFAQMRALAGVTAQINAGLLLDEVLDQVYASFRPLIPYDRIGFSLLEQDDEVVRARWARSGSSLPRSPACSSGSSSAARRPTGARSSRWPPWPSRSAPSSSRRWGRRWRCRGRCEGRGTPAAPW